MVLDKESITKIAKEHYRRREENNYYSTVQCWKIFTENAKRQLGTYFEVEFGTMDKSQVTCPVCIEIIHS